MPTDKPEAFRLIRRSALEIPGQPERKLFAVLYSSPTRRTGRRIQVEEGEAIAFDTGNCYDCGNALAGLNNWVLDEQVCTHCGTKGLTDAHGQDTETKLPVCEACCEKATGRQQTASMSADDLAASVATMAEAKREEPAKLAAVAVEELGEDGFPAEFPF